MPRKESELVSPGAFYLSGLFSGFLILNLEGAWVEGSHMACSCCVSPPPPLASKSSWRIAVKEKTKNHPILEGPPRELCAPGQVCPGLQFPRLYVNEGANLDDRCSSAWNEPSMCLSPLRRALRAWEAKCPWLSGPQGAHTLVPLGELKRGHKAGSIKLFPSFCSFVRFGVPEERESFSVRMMRVHAHTRGEERDLTWRSNP